MTFATSKFVKFLPAATMSMAAGFLLGMSDTIICGNIIGEAGLAALNLMQGPFEFLNFVVSLPVVGTAVLFSTELGASHSRRAKGYFTLGAMAAIVFGLIMGVVFFVCRLPVLQAFGASKEVFDVANHYWRWVIPAIVMTPITCYLATMCYADGNARLSTMSYILRLIVNAAVSVSLTKSIGSAGCAIGSACGDVAAISILMCHFRRKGCMLGFSMHFRLTDIFRIIRASIGDASNSVGKAFLFFTLNAFVIAKFGSDCLPVLAVVVLTIGLADLFDGMGNAVQPLVSVYVGEKNTLLTRRVMGTAIKASLYCGGGMALLLAIFPQLMLKLAGIGSPEIVPQAALAVRLVSVALIGLSLVFLFNSYYIFIGREKLSTVMTVLAVFVCPLVLSVPAGVLFGANGMWIALGIAPVAACVIVSAYLIWQKGWHDYPLFLDSRRDEKLRVFDLALDPDEICATSHAVETHLRAHGIADDRASRAALLAEETFMVVRDRNAGKKVLGEITVDLNDDRVNLVLRDDGEIFDLTDADAQVSSLRIYLVSNLMTQIPYRCNLTTTGFNRNTFRL